jgi:hypothetical protein
MFATVLLIATDAEGQVVKKERWVDDRESLAEFLADLEPEVVLNRQEGCHGTFSFSNHLLLFLFSLCVLCELCGFGKTLFFLCAQKKAKALWGNAFSVSGDGLCMRAGRL